MNPLKYTIIKNREQYNLYCDILEELVCLDHQELHDEVELVTLLIGKWDAEHKTMPDLNPIELLKTLMAENNLKSKDLAEIIGLSKGTASKILNYNKGLSKETIRRLADYFNLSQEAFNKPYRLNDELNRHFRDASLMNTTKNMKIAVAV
jgi:HTH-type transcriptional regulator/antitoxin HigA